MAPHRSSSDVPKLGVRNTRQRTAVVSVMKEIDRFASAREIYGELTERGEKVGLTTVYRTLQSLSAIEAVDVLQNAEGEALYRHCLTETHHHHLVCTICGRGEEIEGGPIEQWAQMVAHRYGYELIGHDAEIYGVCRSCQAERARGENG